MQFEIDITLLAITAALAVRFGVLAATLPVLDMRSVPPLWRVALAFSFAAALAPGIAKTLPAGSVSLAWPVLVMECVRSLVVGALLGFTINLVFTAVRYAGSIVGMQIGFAIVNSYDPMSNSQVSVISQLYYLLAVLLFFATGAHQILVGAMFQSCIAVPPFVSGDPLGGAWYLMREFGTVFSLGLKIAAPVVIVLLLVSASMGVIVKTVPQLNVLVVGFPIKIGVGLITVGLSLVYFRQVTTVVMSGMQYQLSELLMAMK
ncbi:MAG: flagellar biosynthetic protein FliR [Candidatus Krumholzibacteria bacterium]|nr:flagellar biosynthetic protein FliR [Candidatus Krumholzibacteria bacterium]